MNAKRAPDTPNAADADAAPNELTLAFAANLIAARQAKGISQRELAAKAGIARTYLRRIEAGKANAGLGMVMVLARVLKKPASELMKLPSEGVDKKS